MDIRQLEQKLASIENDSELKRAEGELKTIDQQIDQLGQKRNEWAEKKRQREATIVKERHELERQIETMKHEETMKK